VWLVDNHSEALLERTNAAMATSGTMRLDAGRIGRIAGVLALAIVPTAGTAAEAYVRQLDQYVPGQSPGGPAGYQGGAYVPQLPPGAKPRPARPQQVRAQPIAVRFLNQPGTPAQADPAAPAALTPDTKTHLLPSIEAGVVVALPTDASEGILPTVGRGAVSL
jgi:hypothetical protein